MGGHSFAPHPPRTLTRARMTSPPFLPGASQILLNMHNMHVYVNMYLKSTDVSTHHAAAADSGGRGRGKVLHLEHHAHGGGVELDALAVGQAQRAVVVQHCGGGGGGVEAGSGQRAKVGWAGCGGVGRGGGGGGGEMWDGQLRGRPPHLCSCSRSRWCRWGRRTRSTSCRVWCR